MCKDFRIVGVPIHLHQTPFGKFLETAYGFDVVSCCFYDFFNMTSADLVKQSGYKDALDIVRKIIVDNEGKLYNSNDDGSMTKEKMQEKTK